MIYRHDIQFLRGIAVLLVVLFHLRVPGFANGYLGVDIFFVISGFLMASIYSGGDWKAFLLRRAKRLLPAYFAVVGVTLLVGVLYLDFGALKDLGEQITWATLFVSNLGYWTQNSYFAKDDFNPLLHLWSLGVEIQFYLFVPVLFAVWRRFPFLLYVTLIVSLISCLVLVGISPKTAFFMLPFRVWEFSIGCIAASMIAERKWISRKRVDFFWFFSVFSILLLVFQGDLNGESLEILSGHPAAIAFAITILTGTALFVGGKQKINPPLSRAMGWLGDHSYSIYLVHFPIIVLFFYQPFSGTRIPEPQVFDLFILLVGIVFSAWVLRRFVERNNEKLFSAWRCVFAIFVINLAVPTALLVKEHTYSKYELNVRNSIFDRAEYRCGKLFRVLHPTWKVCKLNSVVSSNRALLVGNSHADSIKISFSKVATDKNFEAWFVVQNQPLMNSPGALKTRDILEEVEVRGITHVVLHYDSGGIDTSVLDDLLPSLKVNGVSVDFIAPVPVWNDSVPRMVLQSIAASEEVDSQSYDEYVQKNLDWFQYFKSDMAGDARLLNSGSVFCDPVCKFGDDNGKLYYFDQGHLTLTGAMLLEPLIKLALE
ncbi:MAG: acyltransferase family protein [Thalassospira sp.]|uniref:acyltransferase family protein n=1 Tax=Thalassospira sp. TaxID=1912094 RepID=UPI003A8BBFD5